MSFVINYLSQLKSVYFCDSIADSASDTRNIAARNRAFINLIFQIFDLRVAYITASQRKSP